DEEGYANAMHSGFTVRDTCKPVLTKLALIPLDIEAEINGAFDPVIYRLNVDESSSGKPYVIPEIPTLYGNVGLAVSGYDRANEAENKLAFYGMALSIDDNLRFSAYYDEIGFYETKQIELERNFRLKREGEGVFHHLWRDEHVTADFYRVADGEIRSTEEEPGRHHFTIIINDFHGNTATIMGQFDIAEGSAYPAISPYSAADGFFGATYLTHQTGEAVKQSYLPLQGAFFDDYVTLELAHDSSWNSVTGYLSSPFESTIPMMRNGDRWLGKFPLIPVNPADWTIDIVIEDSLGLINAGSKSWHIQPIPRSGGSAKSSDGQFQARFGPDDLYEPIYCRVDIENRAGDESFVSPIYHLEPHDVPIKGNARLSYTIPREETHPEQLGLYYLSKKGEWQFIDNDLKKLPGKLYGETPALESYVVMRDAEAPTLRWLAPHLTTNDSQPTIRIKAEDELSGVDDRSVRLLIDGQWTLLEYDFETGILLGSPRFKLAPGDHGIKLEVADYNGNRAIMTKTLTVTMP
ncbi:hypothetical protein KJ564_14510, partial [bacterium]|nr:hypothetical protein [bacterium]